LVIPATANIIYWKVSVDRHLHGREKSPALYYSDMFLQVVEILLLMFDFSVLTSALRRIKNSLEGREHLQANNWQMWNYLLAYTVFIL